MEMDAASRTGVDDIRELTDGVRYKPVSARYKIYIIDEVHMLSKQAFNALLKTLEEPPPDVIFIFATTEIQKVPVTVLSRCQRFSLRRVPVELLEKHYAGILAAEKIEAEPAAVGLVARAADGSVRDGLSILDQAIALAGGGAITEGAVRDMLGIADKGLVFDLLEQVMRGDAAAALGGLAALYDGGADPVLVVQEILDLVHFLMRLKLTPAAGEGDPALEGDRARGAPLAAKLSVPVLARAWQMLLKGLAEAQTAPSPLQAVEMVLVRLAYVADLPAPADLVKQIAAGEGGGGSATSTARASAGASSGSASAGSASASAPRRTLSSEAPAGAPRLAVASEPVAAAAPSALPLPQSFVEVVALFEQKREALLRTHLIANVHLVRFEVGRIELRPTAAAPRDLANRLGKLLTEWTGERWVVTITQEEGAATLKEQSAANDVVKRQQAAEHPLVRAVLDAFPGSRIEAVRDIPREAAPDPDPSAPDFANDEAPEGDDI